MKRTLALALALCMIFALCACGQQAAPAAEAPAAPAAEAPAAEAPAAPETKVIGIAIYSMAADSCVALVEEAKKEAAKFGYEIELLDANGDPATQADQIATFIADGVDGIMLNPTDTTSLKPSIEAAKAAGIPVVAVGMEMDADCMALIDAFAGCDDYLNAKYAFEWINTTYTGTDAEVALITGAAGTDPTNKTIQAAEEALDDTFKYVGAFEGNFDAAQCMSVTEDLLVSNPNIKVIFGQDHVTGAGAASAIADAGKTGEVKVVCTCGMTDYLSNIEDGSWDCCAYVLLYQAGYFAVDLFDQIWNGKEVAAKYYAAPMMVTMDNLAEAKEATFDFIAQ